MASCASAFCLSRFPFSPPPLRCSHGVCLPPSPASLSIKTNLSSSKILISTFSSIHRHSLTTFSSPKPPSTFTVFASKGYKMKTHKASAKRFRVTGRGKIVRRRAGKQHLLEKKNTKRKLRLSKMAKFSYPLNIRPWIGQALGHKWRGYKTALKAKYWNVDRPVQEIVERVPDGVDPVQWATLVSCWAEPRDKERATQNTVNAKKQKCPHTMGRHGSVRRQQETATTDRLLLWKMNILHKDGSWTTPDAQQKCELACSMLAESNLRPEDENIEENEKVFRVVMGPEHPGRVRCKGLGVTPSKYYSQSSSTTSTASSYVSAGSAQNIERLETRVGGMESKMGGMENKMGGMETKLGDVNQTLSNILSFMTKKAKKKSKKKIKKTSS